MSGGSSDGDGGGEGKELIVGGGESNGGAEMVEAPVKDQFPSESKMQEGGDSVTIPHVESREDMFVDANEDIQDGQFHEADSEVDSRDEEVSSSPDVEGLGERLEKAVSEKESIEKELKEEKESFAREVEGFRERLEKAVYEKEIVEELKEERESFAREVGGLHKQLKDLANGQFDDGEYGTDGSLSEMINRCSEFVKAAFEQRQQAEKTLSELHQQIEDLNVKVRDNQNVEVAVDRMMYSLSTVVNPGELVDYSVIGKTDYVERGASLLIEQYSWILHEIDQFRHSISEGGSNVEVQGDYSWGSIFATAKAEFQELKRKEMELAEKLAHMEDQNRKLVEEVEKEKAEMGKVKAGLETETKRCANAKEKLNMAVTKGKTLIQVRDSLKQSLAEKSSELEKCLAELQEKSHAAEAAEHCKDELVKYENSVAALQDLLSQRNAMVESFEDLPSMDLEGKLRRILSLVGSLQESLSQKASIVDNIEEILSQTTVPEELRSADVTVRLRWLLDLVVSLNETLSLRNNILGEFEETLIRISIPDEDEVQSEDLIGRLKWLVEDRHKISSDLVEFQKVKDALSLVDMPESVSSSDLVTQIGWIQESIDQAKAVISMLEDEIAKAKETAQNEISQLTVLLTAEIQEKEYLKTELDELLGKHEEMVETEREASSTRDHMVKLLVEASGVETDGLEGSYRSFSDVSLLIGRCLDNIKEKNSTSVNISEVFSRMQSLLYVRDQELMLCKTLLQEEDELSRLQFHSLSESLSSASKELESLREEKESMKSDLNRSEEKAALLREKLTLAVKKGKGLVQDKENLKHLLDEKKSEIEKLKLEIQQQESVVGECQDQINRLSMDLEQVQKLEADLVSVKDQRDQFQQLLLESDNKLQRVMESVDHVTLPVVSTSDNPVGKMKALADYLSESQLQKVHLEQELDTLKEEYNDLASKYQILEQNLKSAENQILELAEEKRVLEDSKKNVELDLQNAVEEINARTSEFTEAHAARRSLEDALSLAENNIAVLVKEREEALVSRATVQAELEKVRDQVDSQSGKLTDAYKSMESMEDTLAQAEAKVALLTEENNNFQAGRTDLENELKKLKDEAELQVGKLEDTSLKVKSLEDALSKAMSDISTLEDDKRIAEEEISTLNSKLKACMDELAGTSGSLASKSVELIGHLADLDVLTKHDELLPVIRQHFKKQFRDLSDMDAILRDMKDCFANGDSQMLKIYPVMDDSHARKGFPDDTDGILSSEMENGDVNSADLDNISLYFKKFSDGLQMKNKILAENFEGFSSFMEEFVEAMLSRLRATKDAVIVTFEQMESMKQKMMDVEIHKEEQDRALTLLEKDRKVLLSACISATKELQFEYANGLELEEGSFDAEKQQTVDVSAGQAMFEDSENVKVAEKLLFATRKAQNQIKSFESTSKVAAAVIEDLQKRLTVSAGSSDSILRERDSFQSRVVELETDADALQISCQKLRDELGDQENILKERDLLQSRVAELEADLEASQNLCQQLKDKLRDYESISSEQDLLKTKVVELQDELEASRNSCRQLNSLLVDYESIQRERDLFQSRVEELERDVEDSENLRQKLQAKLEDYDNLKKKLLMKEQEATDPLMSTSELKALFDKISTIEDFNLESEVGTAGSHSSVAVDRLFYIVDSLPKLQNQINLLASEKDQLQSTVSRQILEIELLKDDVQTHSRNQQDLEMMKDEMSGITDGLEKIIYLLGGNEVVPDQKPDSARMLLPQLEKEVKALFSEAGNLKSQAQELGNRLHESEKVADELSAQVKMLEDSLQSRSPQPEMLQERNMFEAPSRPSGSEISEVDDAQGSVVKNPLPNAALVRTTRKGPTDHLAISIDSESSTLISRDETDEDKGRAFKSLNTSGLIPTQGKSLADRVDGLWVSSGRVLMNRPRARLGLIGYWLLLHIWVLATIL
ncbi:Trans-Golgi network-localized SYP41-interacting protein 1 [Linum perenne]